MNAEIYSADPDAIATRWLVRRDAGMSADEHTRMEAWIAADPVHARAFARAEQLQLELMALPRERVLDLLPTTPARRHGMNWLPHALAACILLVVACTGGFWIYSLPTFEAHFATARGEQRSVALPDGSRIDLNTATELNVVLRRSRREVRLAQGEAMFSVAADAARPFTVDAGASKVRVVGTRFNVRLIDGVATVGVIEGRVHVSGQPDAHLQRAQMAIVDAAGRLTQVDMDVAQIESWRTGRLVFRDALLRDAIAEFARYGDARVDFATPSVSSLRVTGSFETRNIAGFLAALPQVLPVEIRAREDGHREIGPAPPQASTSIPTATPSILSAPVPR